MSLSHAFPTSLAALAVLASLAGCGSLTVAQRNQVAGLVAATVGSTTPNADLEQTYYLGSFDPQDQIPPAIYRIRVRGQSSLLSSVRFASSWVPAEVVDALTGAISIDPKSGALDVNNDARVSGIASGRGMVMFGPEGFREAPRNHRLVIVMGTSPDTVQQAFASALGTVAKVRSGESSVAFDRNIIDVLSGLSSEKNDLRSILTER
mgnify:CR=1 FL=1